MGHNQLYFEFDLGKQYDLFSGKEESISAHTLYTFKYHQLEKIVENYQQILTKNLLMVFSVSHKFVLSVYPCRVAFFTHH